MGALQLQQFQNNPKKIFFGAKYFLCFFVTVTIPVGGGGLQRGGGGSVQQRAVRHCHKLSHMS